MARHDTRPRRHALACGTATLLALLAASTAGAADLFINNIDGANVGFNDPTPATPVGGNSGVTVGEQRLIAFQFAADLWGQILESEVDIVIQASFGPQSCDAQSGVLGGASSISIEADFPGAPQADTWYHSALANALAGFDLNPGQDDISAQFNGNIDNNDDCLAGSNWYYGLDNEPAGTDIDFLNVVMHEIGHGLGFSSFVNVIFGSFPGGTPDVYARNSLDTSLGLHFDAMSNAQRRDAIVNTGAVVWDGVRVNDVAFSVLGALPVMDVTSPPLGEVEVNTAAFGPALPDDGLTGTVVLVDDGTGTGTDACEPLTPASAAAVAGNLALIDRGNCTFASKTVQAQAAGAIGVIVANNEPGGPPPMGGSDATIVIPSVGIPQADGTAIKANLPGVVVTLGFDPDRVAGADDNGFVRLYAPNPVEPGSSFSHFDVVASPNLLMEPSLTATVSAATDVDLTTALFQDIGWTVVDADGDTIPDLNDNCTLIDNPDQRDSNGDGFGNACDADLNDDGTINFGDLALFKSVFLGSDADADFNGDGEVNFGDLATLKQNFLGEPGPSGLLP